MTSQFHVRISGDQLTFSAAHFITLGDGACEPLHGHNYGVAAEVFGPLDDNQWVVDFDVLRQALRAILADLDHRVLLPTGHPTIRVAAGPDEVEVRHETRRWVFPRPECMLLPISSTTAELLAQFIAQRLLAALGHRPQAVRVDVEECRGQSGGVVLTNP